MPPAADRDAAIRTLLAVQTATMEGVSDNLHQHEQSIKELSGRLSDLSITTGQVKEAILEWHQEQRLTLWRVFLRSIDKAADKDPLKVLIIIATSAIVLIFVALGGLYSLIWHENPATVIRELETLIPFFGASKP